MGGVLKRKSTKSRTTKGCITMMKEKMSDVLKVHTSRILDLEQRQKRLIAFVAVLQVAVVIAFVYIATHVH